MALAAHVSIVTIGAYDLDVMRLFYSRLGWVEARVATAGWACFLTGGAVLTLFPMGDLATDTQCPAPARLNEGAFRGVTLAVNVESDELVDAGVELARRAGATILKEPGTATWGMRAAYFADPEGNVWEIACMPSLGLRRAL